MAEQLEGDTSPSALNRDRILREAVRIADDEGIDAVTMRRLGRELGAARVASDNL